MQHEITGAGTLLDERGRLREAGFSKRELLSYDRNSVRASRLRIKEWDYYLVSNDRYAVALTVSDNGYMGLMSASLLNFEQVNHHTASTLAILPLGKLNMPASSQTGDVRFENKKCRYSFEITGAGRHLQCEVASFRDGKPFTCDLLLTDEPEDSMVIATPFFGKHTAFYYNRKIVGMRASGSAQFDGRVYEFLPENSFGTLDWGRGVWTYANTWYWSSASGLVDGVSFGFNLGYGFGNTKAASENMLFYNGRAHKLGNVVFNIPKDSDDRHDLLKSWAIGSDDGRVNLHFFPILDRSAFISALLVSSDQHQVFGRFSGTVTLDDGKIIKLRDFVGFAEKVKNRW